MAVVRNDAALAELVIPRRRGAPLQPPTEVTLVEDAVAIGAERSVLPFGPLFARQPVLRAAVVAETAGLQTAVDARPTERVDVAGRQRLEYGA